MWMEWGCKVETNNFTLSLFGASCCINLPTKGRFVFKAKSVKLVPPQILSRIALPTETFANLSTSKRFFFSQQDTSIALRFFSVFEGWLKNQEDL